MAEFWFFLSNFWFWRKSIKQIEILNPSSNPNFGSLTLNSNFWFWCKFWISPQLVSPNLDRSRRQLFKNTKIVKFGQNLVPKFLISPQYLFRCCPFWDATLKRRAQSRQIARGTCGHRATPNSSPNFKISASTNLPQKTVKSLDLAKWHQSLRQTVRGARLDKFRQHDALWICILLLPVLIGRFYRLGFCENNPVLMVCWRTRTTIRGDFADDLFVSPRVKADFPTLD